jgi:hypothetical protein
VPDNFFVVAELRKLADDSNAGISKEQQDKAGRMADKIQKALAEHAVVDDPDVGTMYCYEVSLIPQKDCNMMDDANVPSLLALPYIADGAYDPKVYAATRSWVLSSRNPYFYESGSGTKGLGSPHTPGRNVWPLGLISQGLTATSTSEVVQVLSTLLNTDAGTDLMHEAFNVNNGGSFSRSWFDWPNALFVELVDSCCANLVQKLAPQAYVQPTIDFASWTTCGFHDGQCQFDAVKPQLGKKACVRYGSTFSGFVTKLVDADSSVRCDSSLGSPRRPSGYSGYFPLPFHCAVASAELCSA